MNRQAGGDSGVAVATGNDDVPVNTGEKAMNEQGPDGVLELNDELPPWDRQYIYQPGLDDDKVAGRRHDASQMAGDMRRRSLI